MAITTLSFSPPLDSPQPLFLKTHNPSSLTNNNSSINTKPFSVSYTPTSSSPVHPLRLHKSRPLHFTIPSSSFHSSSSPPTSSSDTHLNNPLAGGGFLDAEKSEILTKFSYTDKINGGSLMVRVMGEEEVDITVQLLAESFAESMSVPSRFVTFLGFLVKQYVRERRAVLPHAATLVGFFKREDGKEELGGTVEISFDKQGANASPPTPISPVDCPYICNMAVKKQLRRRSIGWHLLQASEQLISQMTISRDIYLHCRMIDTVPLNMYKKAGYRVIKTDSLFTLLTFQRRKHLMCKKLPERHNLHSDMVGAQAEPAS
ncbi:hypothetical protein AAC387_Pa03g3073 [Persea americana]